MNSKNKANLAVAVGVAASLFSKGKGSKATLISYDNIVAKAERGESLSVDELRDFVFAEELKCSQIFFNFYKHKRKIGKSQPNLMSAWNMIEGGLSLIEQIRESIPPYKLSSEFYDYEDFLKEHKRDIATVPLALGLKTQTDRIFMDAILYITNLFLEQNFFTQEQLNAMGKDNPAAYEWVAGVVREIEEIYENRELISYVAPPNDFWQPSEFWGTIEPFLERKMRVGFLLLNPPGTTAFVWDVYEQLFICMAIENAEQNFAKSALNQMYQSYGASQNINPGDK